MKPIDNRTSKRKPWMKWYTSDWRAEPTLRMVSRGARSVWVDLLGLMHESTLIGTLLLNGRIPTLQDLAKVFGDDPQKLAEWMDELKDAGVYSVDEDGAIYSRKMRHAAEISEKGRKDVQKRGGSWAPGKKKPSPKGKPIGDPNRGAIGDPMPQRLEARTKKEELEPTLSSNPESQSSEAIASEPSGSVGEIIEPTVPKEPPAPVISVPSPLDFQRELWSRGVAYLKANGASDSHARSQIGKWRKATGSDFEVLELLSKAEGEAVSEPMAFIEGILKLRKGKSNGKATSGQHGRNRQIIDDHPLGNFAAIADRIRAASEGGFTFDA